MQLEHVIILSIIEGLTEFLPISSTGHMILASNLLGIVNSDFVKSFEIIIQLGAIMAVLSLYWRKFLQVKILIPKLITAFIPTAVAGLLLYPIIKNVLLSSPLITVIALFVGGLLLIAIERFYKERGSATDKVEEISYKNAFIIGIFQSISIVPGVSRAASTIVGGLLVNVNRKSAVEFSFLLAVPTMMAATGLDILKSEMNFSSSQYISLGIGFILSFIVAILSIKFLLAFIKSNSFTAFGVYRIVLALVYLLLVIKF